MHVDGKVGRHAEQLRADLAGKLGRGHGKALIAALALDLEGLCTALADRGKNVLADGADDGIEALFGNCRAADADDTEYLADSVICSVNIAFLIGRLDVCDALRACYLEFSERRNAMRQLPEHDRLKLSLVKSLKDDLAVFAKDDFFHGGLRSLVFYDCGLMWGNGGAATRSRRALLKS